MIIQSVLDSLFWYV